MKLSAKTAISLASLAIAMAMINCSFATQLFAGEEATSSITPVSTVAASTEIPKAEIPTAEALPTEIPSVSEPTATNIPATNTPQTEEIAPSPVPMETCDEEVCILSGSFLLERPVGGEGRKTIDTSARFGVYQAAKDDSVRGVYFLNSTGTPVIAAANGTVVVAGDDSQKAYTRNKNIYGNLVIIRHDLPGVSGPVFTLYAHLSEVQVSLDQEVKTGQQIGLVGSTGSVSGSTLLFEVRLGENSYQAVRNPELWLVPLPDDSGQPMGALVGRIMDVDGKYLKVPNIVIEQLAGQGLPAIDQFYSQTYSGSSLIGQPPYKENFAMGGLPTGDYQISFLFNGMQQ